MKKKIFFVLLIAFNLFGTNYAKSINCEEVLLHCGNTPSGTFDKNNILWIAYEYNNHIYVIKSGDLGRSFSKPIRVNTIPHEIYTNGENRPKIKVKQTGEVFVTWAEKTKGRFSGDIRFSRSLDQGKTFSEPIIINTDRSLIGHRFDALHLNKKGDLFIAWFDKRDKQEAKSNDISYRGTALYYIYSHDNGETFSENIKLADHTCECCRITVDNDTNNNIHYLWRHIFNTNTRDHALITINSDKLVSKMNRVSFDEWHIDSCPHHGPDMTINEEDRIFYTWFSQGEKNKGIMFGEYDIKNDVITNTQSTDSTGTASHPNIISFNDKLYHVWKRFSGEETYIIGRISSDWGESWSRDIIIKSTSNASDHP